MKNENLTIGQIDKWLHDLSGTDWYGMSDGGYLLTIHSDLKNEKIVFTYYGGMCYEIESKPLTYEFEIACYSQDNFMVSVKSEVCHGVTHFSAIDELERFIAYAIGEYM